MTKFATSYIGRIKIFAFLITVALVIFYDFFPKRTLQLHPNPSNNIYIATDQLDGGNSNFFWSDEANYEWVCDYKIGAPYPYCNIAIAWSERPYKQLDLSLYGHLKIDLDYQGNAQYLNLFIRNFHPYPGDIDELKTGKFNTLAKPVGFFDQITPIKFSQLRVSDWWISEFNVAPHLVMPDVSKTLSIGLGIPNPVPLGQHKFRLNSIYAEGVYIHKETLYFSIIIFWTIFLLGEILVKYIMLNKKIQSDNQLLSQMSEQSNLYKLKSETDNLTTILNREGFYQITQKLAEQDLLHQYALLLIDLDYFKQINDKFGHAAGDKVLKEAAQIINDSMRSYDIVARWGGEEFVVLFHCLLDEKLFLFAEKIRKAIELASFDTGQELIKITTSIGVAKLTQSETLDKTLIKADQALYNAKGAGRNQVVIYKEQ